MADRGDQLAAGRELADQVLHFRVAAEPIRHEAARDHDALEVLGFHQFDRSVGAAGIAVLAAVDGFAFRTRDRDVAAGLRQPQLRIPQFEVFVVVADEHQETEVGQWLIECHGWAPF